MKRINRALGILLVALIAVSAFSQTSTDGSGHTFGWKGNDFLLDGKPFVIRSGEMHYPRVPRIYWRDRFKKARAMGLNVITTYVFWNLHEPSPGKFDFTGDLDIAEFIREAGQEGLYVIVRPGPYICSEWDFGGFPAWLLKTPDIKVRSADKRFIDAAASYMKAVGKQLAPLQITHGGNIIMAQVENEYGSFGSDHDYMNAVKKMMLDAGFDVQLFTADGGSEKMLDGGGLPGLPQVVNFGAGDNIKDEFKVFDRKFPKSPRMSGEYWVGWFDQWGEKHNVLPPWGGNDKRKPAEVPAEGVEYFLSNNTSFNLYMFHGGTSFGFMPGANFNSKMPLQPDTTSYDYGGPLDEAGRPNDKFYALRDVIQKHFPNEKFPTLPAPLPMIEVPAFELTETAAIDPLLTRAVRSDEPPTMESLDQSYGFLLYRMPVEASVSGRLGFGEIRDYAVLTQGQARLGALDRRLNHKSLDVKLEAGKPLDILVENMGRINFGARLVDDRKGIVGPVTFDGKQLTGWQTYSLPMNDLSALKFSKRPLSGPAFYRASFTLKTTGDTFLDTSSWEKGHVWVNGHHLGRFWRIGPQQTLYVPAAWLRKGKNEIIVLDVGTPQRAVIRGVRDQIFGNQ
jgi:beta-galactosidase